MFASRQPHELTPDERLQAVAAILARGILRIREHRTGLRVIEPENPAEFGDAPLEVLKETVLSVTSGG